MMTTPEGANGLVEFQLGCFLEQLERATGSDCLAYSGPIVDGVDDAIRDAIEALRGRTRRRRPKLLFVLETQGGFAEVARRISDTARNHYRVVDFLIPSHAMSAGTILAMSGDAIYMDYYSVLGPIDPQVPSQDRQKLIPALGYLIKYEELLAKANSGKAGPAELEILLNFDQGALYSYEQARDLSVSLLEEWLVKYKFKNWKTTETGGTKVTLSMKKKRAREIARMLNNAKRWNSHGIGINMEIIRKDLNLKIDDFGEIPDINDPMRAYHKLLTDYMQKIGQTAVVHTRIAYRQLF